MVKQISYAKPPFKFLKPHGGGIQERVSTFWRRRMEESVRTCSMRNGNPTHILFGSGSFVSFSISNKVSPPDEQHMHARLSWGNWKETTESSTRVSVLYRSTTQQTWGFQLCHALWIKKDEKKILQVKIHIAMGVRPSFSWAPMWTFEGGRPQISTV